MYCIVLYCIVLYCINRLIDDLKHVDRTKIDWIIVYYHTPSYCSNQSHYKSGSTMLRRYEKLLVQHADMVLSGHVHAYERTHPVYRGSRQEGGLVHVTGGISGSSQGLYYRWAERPEWSAFRQAVANGYGFLEIHNRTHAVWNLVEVASNNASRTILDTYWFDKSKTLHKRMPSWRHHASSPAAYPEWDAEWDAELEEKIRKQDAEEAAQMRKLRPSKKARRSPIDVEPKFRASDGSNPNSQFGTLGLVFLMLLMIVAALVLFDLLRRRQQQVRHFGHTKDV
jgi:hypothetical protein